MLTWGGTSMIAAFVELHAGDAAAAGRAARAGYDVLCGMGEKGFLSSVAGYLAEAAFLQGSLDEALQYCDVAAGAAGQWDLEGQSYWRDTRARVLARRGEADEAERLARESVELLAPTDYLSRRADSLTALADVLLVTGRGPEARPALAESLALYEQKGDVVYAARARAALTDLP
jgi:ATP/maltotriose-dependent transcriptional regulator MalT